MGCWIDIYGYLTCMQAWGAEEEDDEQKHLHANDISFVSGSEKSLLKHVFARRNSFNKFAGLIKYICVKFEDSTY